MSSATFVEGRCEDVMAEGRMRGRFDLVFADPPFNIGHAYAEYRDNVRVEEYLDWTDDWVSAAINCLNDGGSLMVHGPHELCSYIENRFCTRRFARLGDAPMRVVNHVVLHQRFGQFTDSKLIRSHHVLLWMCRAGERWRFNRDESMTPSERLRLGDRRVARSRYGGMRPWLDVWYGPDLGRVQGNNAERWVTKNGALVDHPNQLAERYVARAVRLCTWEDDRVLDPFAGSGTTAVVCDALGRDVTTIDVGGRTLESARRRVQRGAVRDLESGY